MPKKFGLYKDNASTRAERLRALRGNKAVVNSMARVSGLFLLSL